MQYYIIVFMIFAMVIIMQRQRLTLTLHRIRKKKRGKIEMTELIKNYIGKECLIYTCISSSSQLKGVIKSCNDGWIELETNGLHDIVNCEYITRIREYPKNKKGKRKSVILD